MNQEIIKTCLENFIVPLEMNESAFEIATTQENEMNANNLLRFLLTKPVNITIWSKAKVETELKNYAINKTINQSDKELIKFIDNIFHHALILRASDIHIESEKQHCRIRIRIDGVLQNLIESSPFSSSQICARLKLLAHLDISEKRLPQDGLLQVEIKNKTISFRISVIPVLHGEKIVLRFIENQIKKFTIDSLGMQINDQKKFEQTLKKPQGLILVTGPTGSGKTSTLYASLHFLNQNQVNICSLEDPIEQPINGINQTQINEKYGLNFHSCLRALLRQDPDILMIGEIRDQQTAKIAIEAAQTGHLVLSTLHTNSTTETIIRLKQMNIEPYQIASSLKLVISQRLVRKLCTFCNQMSSAPFKTKNEKTIFHSYAKGCEHCIGGYYGRVGIFELLQINNEISQLILQNAAPKTLLNEAKKQEMKTLSEQSLILLENKETSLEEIYRILGNFENE